MKKILAVAFISALSVCAAAADRPATAKKGQPAPQINVGHMVSGGLKAVADWDELKGKAVVLEFWGPTCEPCVENIPHLNDLAEKFKDQPVVFLSVAMDEAAEVTEFLKTHEMKGNVAADGLAVFKSFKIKSVPQTVLLDKEGIVKAFAYPSEVREKTLEDLLAGRELTGLGASDRDDAGIDEDAASYFSVSPSSGGFSMSYSDRSFKVAGLALSYAIETAMRGSHGVEYKDVPAELLEQTYDITAGVSTAASLDGTRLRDLIMAGLNGAFPFRMAAVKKTGKVYLLKKAGADGAGLAPYAGKGGGRKMSHDKDSAYVDSTGGYIADLASELEGWLKTPVLDETGLGEGRYSFALKVAPVSIKTVNAALKKELGLRLVEARRTVEIIEVKGTKPVYGKHKK